MLYILKDCSKSIVSFFRKRLLFLILFIILLILFFVMFSYGIYLDTKLCSRINGRIWQLPTLVYSRIMVLEPNMSYSCQDVVDILLSIHYRQVSKIVRSGEFVVYCNTLELLRRPFKFPDGQEEEVHVCITFSEKKLLQITNKATHLNFRFFRLDPKLISVIESVDGIQRLFVPISRFPKLLINMLISIEDKHFYQHHGINFYSICRALLANIFARRTVQGGSTLTQQLIKNLFLSSDRSFWRKINEIYMSLIFECRYNKYRILEIYLNEVYFGQSGNEQIRGFPLASLYYFGCPIDELSLDQQAMLVGMVKGASLFNPWRHPKLVLERRNIVLQLLHDQCIIDTDSYISSTNFPLGIQPKGRVLTSRPAFIKMVREELLNKIRENVNIRDSGIIVFTTLDPISQNSVEQAVSIGIKNLRSSYCINDLEGAVVILDRLSGEVRAMVGGSDPKFSGFNRAIKARRSVGSLIKPATYLTALSMPDKYRLNTWITDEPIMLKQDHSNNIWVPKNYDRKFRGKVMLIDALVQSLNIPTVNLGLSVGLDYISNFFKRMGIPEFAITSLPSMLLGAIDLTPIEVAQVFQTIASGGNYSNLTSVCCVINEDGGILYQHFPQSFRVIPAESTYLTLYAMQQAVLKGTSHYLHEKFSSFCLAAKTGTTNNLRDSWCVGIDEKEVTTIWIGRDNNGRTKLTGASGALYIYHVYLNYKPPIKLNLVPPDSIVQMFINIEGDFISHDDGSNGLRLLPIWTSNPKDLLNNKKEQQIIHYSHLQDSSIYNLHNNTVIDSIKELFN